MKLRTSTGIVVALGVLAACSQPEYILPGKREELRSLNPQTADETEIAAAADAAAAEVVNQTIPITLPQQVNHSSWTHIGGNVTHQVQHPAFGHTPSLIWTADIGQGNDRKHRITAEPVVADGRIYTLDSRAQVVATSTSGQTLWSRNLTPASDNSDDASGGGLAISGGQLFVTSAFGTLTALDASSGAVQWQQKLEAPATGAPSVRDGIVYVSSKDNIAWGVDASDGKVRWQLTGTPSPDGVVGVSSPAITERLAIVPFTSGELVGALRKGGVRTWTALVTGERPGRAYSIVTDITGEPVVKDDVIYTGNPVGRTVALSMSGERIWTADEGATSPVWVSGGSVFLISDEARLVRLDEKTGDRIWSVELPYFTKEKAKRRKAIYANYGPVLAGGNLWVTSSDGVMRGFDPKDGSLVANTELPGGAATRPAIVNGVAYVVSRDGKLLALR
ncbi:PQQ-binding-like beta-propeller repeat protein [Aliiroseovarius sp. KMU-50]|uniref:PQQ-binding-like beta-propeller repeat protein n=1 Tax=Aliiroseovarius salicola TaxID=3009082 RepID=A0ABT4W1H8_9RHOB|nr:PQQ-binding-like beta-propeller repeat protein [Aliiroseovarius sp. KMU-50]MDA5094364.1 PQQ-binding-like beta-propeller repeat protein [Aliiroseovarius sp. KMU-50]